MPGSLLALLAAALFGLNSASARRGVLTGTVFQGLAVSVPLGVPIFAAAAAVSGGYAILAGLPWQSLALLAGAGLGHFAIGRYCNYRAIKAMGANLTGTVVQTNLLLALGLAIWLLDESLSPLRMLGIVLILSGPAIMLRGRRHHAVRPNPDFTPSYGEGYLFAFAAGLCFGTSPVMLRAVLDGTGPAGGVAGGIVAYGAAALAVTAAILATPARQREVLAMSARTAKWFTLAGVLVCGSQMCRFMALSIAPVSVVAPIQQTSSVFRVIFAWIINRDHEDFGLWTLLGMGVSLMGALALSLSVEMVIAALDLPAGWTAFLRLSWP